ncbi:MAG: mevalonate kinase [Candidatus Bilamarchaeaceae archaeon]
MGEGKSLSKAILFGEHFVVHGSHAIGAALSREIRVRISPSENQAINIACGQIVLDASRKILDSLGLKGNYFIEVDAEIPSSAGLGWSAAYSVALARAAADEKGISLSPEDASAYAYEGERVFHGNPSGLDNALCALGGALLFKKGEEPIPIRIGAPLHIIVAYVPRTSITKDLVAGVSRIKEERPEFFSRLMEKEEALVLRAREALEWGRIPLLGKLMDENQEYLRQLGVSSPALEEMISLAKRGGAIGAKLTGAGGGGCAIALAESKADAASVLGTVGAKYAAFEARIG